MSYTARCRITRPLHDLICNQAILALFAKISARRKGA